MSPLEREGISFPADFTVDVGVLCGEEVIHHLEVTRRPGHFILFADGALHHAEQSPSVVRSRPPRQRLLHPDQVQRVWVMLVRLGYTDRTVARSAMNPKVVMPGPDEIAVLLTMSAGGRRWSFLQESSASHAMDPGTREVLHVLADLAWVDRVSYEPPPLPVRRYDFGPDPYVDLRRR